MSLNEKKLNYGKSLGEIHSDFDLGYDVEQECSKCGSTLEWNGNVLNVMVIGYKYINKKGEIENGI